jgi:hypothetical protein
MAFAEEDKGGSKVGLTASLQNSQLEILVPIWVNEQFVLTPAIGVSHVSDYLTDFGFGMVFRHNLRVGEAVPYIGIRWGALLASPEEGDGTFDMVFGPLVGGEYFLRDKLSVGVEAQLNIAQSDENSYRFNNPDGTNINLATAVMATFYF